MQTGKTEVLHALFLNLKQIVAKTAAGGNAYSDLGV